MNNRGRKQAATATIYTGSLTRPCHLVKAQITALGLQISDVAAQADLRTNEVSRELRAARPNRRRRRLIFRAVKRLARCPELTYAALWRDERRWRAA